MISSLLLGMILSVCTSWFPDMVALPSCIVSTCMIMVHGRTNVHCLILPISLHTVLNCSWAYTLSCLFMHCCCCYYYYYYYYYYYKTNKFCLVNDLVLYGGEKPTRCHSMIFCSCEQLYMFPALICPSSGAPRLYLDYNMRCVVPKLLWSAGRCRAAGCVQRERSSSTTCTACSYCYVVDDVAVFFNCTYNLCYM
jgi:hypothetical protein